MEWGLVPFWLVRVATATFVFSVGSSVAAAHDDAESWFRDQWTRAQQLVDLGDVSISWVEENWEVPSAVELEQMRQSVAGHPNHPDRSRLEQYQRRAGGVPDRLHASVWAGGPGRWRYCKQAVAPDGSLGSFLDVASNRDVIWCLLPGSATVISRKHAPPPGRDFASIEPTVQRRVGQLLFSGLGELSTLQPTINSFVHDSEHSSWRATATTEFGSSMQMEGTWNEPSGQGTIDRVELFAPSDTTPNTVIVTRGQRLPLMTDGLPGAASEVEIAINGRRSTRLVEVRVDTNVARLDDVTRPPTSGAHVDLVRGEQTITSYADYRTGVQIDTTSVDNRIETRTTPLLDATRGPSYLKYAGRLVGSLVIMGAIVWHLAAR